MVDKVYDFSTGTAQRSATRTGASRWTAATRQSAPPTK